MLNAFKNAWNGLKIAAGERNLRIQINAAVLAVLVAWTADADGFCYAVIAAVSGMVLAAETFNTAVERLCDRVTTEFDAAIGAVKDIAAGAVLITAIAAAVTGAFLFLNPAFLDALGTGISSGRLFVSIPLAVITVGLNILTYKRKAG